MFTFNEERLAYLLSKLQAEINKKVDKDKYVKEASKNTNGAFTVVADNEDPFNENTMIKLSDIQSVIPDILVGEKVDAFLEDRQLSAEVFTPQEKAILAEILAEGSLEELINKRLAEIDMEGYAENIKDIDDPVIQAYLLLREQMLGKRNDN